MFAEIFDQAGGFSINVVEDSSVDLKLLSPLAVSHVCSFPPVPQIRLKLVSSDNAPLCK